MSPVRGFKAGAIASVWVLAGGQLVAAACWALTGALDGWSWIRIGVVDALAVARVGLDVHTAPTSGMRQLFPGLFAAPTVRVSAALGTGTVVAVALLVRAARSALGSHPGPDPASPHRSGVTGVLAFGACVGGGFALPLGVASLLGSLRLSQGVVISVRPVVWQAFLFPFVLGAVAAMASTLAHVGPGSRESGRLAARGAAVAAARGGWHALVAAVVLAFLATLVAAAVRPATTGAYGRWLADRGGPGGVIATYQALAAANQSVGVLAIALGSCVEVDLGESEPTGETPRVCLGGVDAADGALLVVTGGREEVPFGPIALVSVVVPAIATVLGGRRAAEGAKAMRERIVRATAGGLTFGLVVGLAAWAASVSITAAGTEVARIGPSPLSTAALGLAWGIGGGLIGALVPGGFRSPTGSRARPR